MNFKTESAVYLPIEICKREIWSNAFLAAKLAIEGSRVYVFESTYFDSVGWPYGGIYMGKNCFRSYIPCDSKFYLQMKNMGIDLWHHDTEGGFYPGIDEESVIKQFAQRFDPSLLDECDKIFTWGKWQYEYYSEKKLLPKTYITGHPNFELYQPKYASAFESWDAINTDGLENFVLINTRFSASYSSRDKSNNLTNVASYFSENEATFVTNSYVRENIKLDLMIYRIREIAQSLRDTLFVVRPHPSEDPSFYQTYLNDLHNVSVIATGDVGSWIRRAKLVIHHQCTTGVQAEIAQKPVISLQLPTEAVKPGFESSLMDMELLNQVGSQLKEAEEIIEFIKNPILVKKEHNIWSRSVSNLDSIETIAEIYRESLSKTARRKVNNKYSSLHKYFARESSYFIKKNILKRLTVGEQIFDYQLFDQLPKMVALAGNFYGNQPQCKKISSYCYEISL